MDDSEQEKGVLVNTKWPALGMRGVRGMGLGTWADAECNGYFSPLHRVAHRMGKWKFANITHDVPRLLILGKLEVAQFFFRCSCFSETLYVLKDSKM